MQEILCILEQKKCLDDQILDELTMDILDGITITIRTIIGEIVLKMEH